MRKITSIVAITILFGIGLVSCNTFEGIATNPGETYTTTYNLPGERIVPYNNPAVNISTTAPEDEFGICEGLVAGDSIPRCAP